LQKVAICFVFGLRVLPVILRTPSTGSGDAVGWVASVAGRVGETAWRIGKTVGRSGEAGAFIGCIEAGALDDLAHRSFVCLLDAAL